MKMNRLNNLYGGLDPGVYVLFVARIVNRMGDFVQLFLVLYLTGRLGFSESAAGRFVSLTGILMGFGVLLGGSLADRLGRKRILLFCQTIVIVAYGACGFLPGTMAIPWIIFLSSIFRGATWPVTNAMVTDLTDSSTRQKAFSLLYLGTNIGVAIGPIIAGLLFENYIQWIFWGDALTTLFAAVSVLFFVPDTKPDAEAISRHESQITEDNAGERAESGNTFAVLLKRPALLAYMGVTILVSFVYSQHGFSLPLQLNQLFAQEGPKFYGYVMTCNAVVVIICTPLLTKITGKNRPIYNLSLAALLYAVGFGTIWWISSLAIVMITTVIWTFGEIIMVTNANVFIANNTPITHRGRFNGIINWVNNIGWAISPVVSGIIIEASGVRIMWPIVGCVALLAYLGYMLIGTATAGKRKAAVQQ